MELSKMNKQDLILLIEAQVKAGKLNEEDIATYNVEIDQSLVNLIHTYFCERAHEGEDCCQFYNEVILSGGPAHDTWANATKVIVNEFKLDKEQVRSAISILNDIIAVLNQASEPMQRLIGLWLKMHTPIEEGEINVFNFVQILNKG